MITRRDFLKFVGGIGMIILTPIRRLNLFPRKQLEQDIMGELYSGFLILPEGAPIPSIVKGPKLGFPNECGIGVVSEVPDRRFITQEYDTLEEFTRDTRVAMYSLKEIPKDTQLGSVSTIKTIDGEIYLVSLGYETYRADVDVWQCTIWLLAQMDFPYPIPIWHNNPVEPNGPAVRPEKVDFLPKPGIMVRTQNGYVFHWIENSIFFTLVFEDIKAYSEIELITKNLAK